MMFKPVASGIFVLLVCLYSFAAKANTNYTIEQVRTLYGQGVEDADAAKKLFDLAASNGDGNPLLLAYRGGAEALLAKHAFNPYNKLDYLNKSMRTLESAIKADPGNAEIRFIRFSIQYYIPRFLGYSKDLTEDAGVIAFNFSQLVNELDVKTSRSVGEFMISSGSCSQKDLLIIEHNIYGL